MHNAVSKRQKLKPQNEYFLTIITKIIKTVLETTTTVRIKRVFFTAWAPKNIDCLYRPPPHCRSCSTALALQEAALGGEDLRVGATCYQLAETLAQLLEFEEAEPLVQRAIEIGEKGGEGGGDG